MAFALKTYQQDCLTALEQYLRHVVELNSRKAADTAFYEQTRRIYNPVPQLPEMPYVCIRVPTGGGKTVLASYAVGVATRSLLRQERSLVLWLAPTNTIVEQTAKALKDRKHPYREALDRDFGGSVTVMTITEALYLQRGTLDSDTVVIISTLAALRVNDTEGRKIYEANGNLMAHFTGLTEQQIQELTDGKNDASEIAPSLANVIRLHHPIVIMDEAHNARTELTFDTLQRFRPACVVELTATPVQTPPIPSNVLYHVSAAELKGDAMIKLPIKLKCRPQWKEAVQAALAKQAELETLAKKEEAVTGEHIRPIVLFQAQNESDVEKTITPDVLKKCLMEEFSIPEAHIIIATGKKDELSGKNVMDRECPVRFIITVAKLREGWDCSWAYVLCSVTNLSSKVAVEQILGRVLRLPRAHRKEHTELNMAYAFATSQKFHDTAQDLTDALVESGFTKFEAKGIVRPDEGDLFDGGAGPLFTEPVVVTVDTVPDLAQVPREVVRNIQFDGARKQLAWTAGQPMTDSQKVGIQKAFKAQADRDAVEKLCRKSRGQEAYPAALGLKLRIPMLAVRDGSEHSLFEDQFLDTPWQLRSCDPALSEQEFTLPTGAGETALVDVNAAGKLEASFITEVQQQLALFERGPKTVEELAVWLARSIKAIDITHSDMAVFLQGLVKSLMDVRSFTLEQLLASRFKLLDAATAKVQYHRISARVQEYQRFLLPDFATPVEATPAVAFEFPLTAYPANRIYEGTIKFQNHYYERPADMNGEEAQCAAVIDSHPKVKYWVRNLVRPDFAFWLQLPNGKFYPDFVAELTDGRYLVVEYKGEHLESNDDTAQKEAIGKLWEARSGGKCVFRLVGREDYQNVINAV